MWSIDPTHLPKKGTPVTLRLRLKKNAEPEPESKPRSDPLALHKCRAIQPVRWRTAAFPYNRK